MTGAESLPAVKGAFKGAFDLIGGMMTAKTYSEVQPKIASLMQQIMSMYEDNQAMAEANAELKEKVRSFESFAAEKEKYKPNSEDSGVVTFIIKSPADEQAKTHRFCANCFSVSRIQFLQPTPETKYESRLGGTYRAHHCHGCDSTVYYGFKPNAPQLRVNRRTTAGY